MSESHLSALIIDDEEDVSRLICRCLSLDGYETVAVDSGAAAIEIAKRRPFDVALTDLEMPGMDGLATLDALKRIDPEMPVLLLTGYGTASNAVAALKQGAYDYLEKPFSGSDLLRVLRRAIDQRRLEGQAVLDEVRRALLESWTSPGFVQRIAALSRDVVSADLVSLLRGPDKEENWDVHMSGDAPTPLREHILSIADRCTRSRAARRWPGGPGEEDGDRAGSAGFSSDMVYPLVARERVMGALVFARHQTARPFSLKEFERGARFAAEVALGLDNSRLYAELEGKVRELTHARDQLILKEKLAVTGQLAAGIAHEINTPIQFVGDSVHFLKDGLTDLLWLVGEYRRLLAALEGSPAVRKAWERRRRRRRRRISDT